jgi:MSHA biogenesis protein MshP
MKLFNIINMLHRSSQRGFSIITAIFLLVVLGALGTMMVTFFAAQQQSSALDVMGSRAYQAARAGIEWSAYYVEQPATPWPDCATYTISKTLFAANTLKGTLSPFEVKLTCSSASFVEDGDPIWIYDLVSTATYGTAGTPDYVERVLNVKMGR